MANTEKFLEGITAEAIRARDEGDTMTLNRLSANVALRDYVNNVVLLGSITPDQFQYWYPEKWTEIGYIAEQYEQTQRDRTRMDSIESKLDRLAQMMEQVIAIQPAKAKAKLAEALADEEPEAEPEAPAVDQAEGEPETETAPDEEPDEEAEAKK